MESCKYFCAFKRCFQLQNPSCDPTFLSYTCLSLGVFEVLRWDMLKCSNWPIKWFPLIYRSQESLMHSGSLIIVALKNQPAKQWGDQSIRALSLNTLQPQACSTTPFSLAQESIWSIYPLLYRQAWLPHAWKFPYWLIALKLTSVQWLREVRDRWRGRQEQWEWRVNKGRPGGPR